MSRRTRAAASREGARIALRFLPSAREAFEILSERVAMSRPIIGQNRGAYWRDKSGRKRYLHKPTPVYGPPTFRNILLPKLDDRGREVVGPGGHVVMEHV